LTLDRKVNKALYKVVVFPLPVGPVTKKIP
jgi:hypothetical protein